MHVTIKLVSGVKWLLDSQAKYADKVPGNIFIVPKSILCRILDVTLILVLEYWIFL